MPGRNVLFVGRLVPEKNLHLLLEAWRRLPQDAVLNIAGSGPLLGWLQEQARGSSNIRVLGFVDDDRLWALFRGTDLLVCPSQFEGFGMPPMQALYFEKACLVSDLPIFRSIYGQHVDYFPPGDADALANGVLRLLADPARCRQMGRDGRSHVLQNFTWQAAAQSIEASLLAHQPGQARQAAS
jgi:glycosyltransferase involved in cell wall biosynthesis